MELRVVARAVARLRDDIRRLADDNVHMVDYLLDQAESRQQQLKQQKGALANGGGDVKLLGLGADAAVEDMLTSEDEAEEWIGLD